MTHKITRTNIKTIIRETVKNALAEADYDEVGSLREKPEEKKARRDGKNQAIEKLSGKTVEELKTTYLKLEHQAEQSYQDSVKHAFIWGALDQIKKMIKKMGQNLPRKNQDPWTR